MERMSFAEAAVRLLVETGGPLHYRDITDIAIRRRMIFVGGKTPEQSMLSALRGDSRFQRLGKGVYALVSDADLDLKVAAKRARRTALQEAADLAECPCGCHDKILDLMEGTE